MVLLVFPQQVLQHYFQVSSKNRYLEGAVFVFMEYNEIMFPLKQRKLIRGCQAHINAGLGCGIDWVAVYVDLFSPFDGVIETFYGKQGGNWIRLIRPNGDRIEFAHLSKYIIKSGSVKAGQLIAVTGNTGSITTNPHLHCQIFRDGKRLDPDRYNWEESVIINPMPTTDKLSDHIVDGMPADERIAALKEQVKRLQEESRTLTEALETAKEKEKEYYDAWQTCLDRPKDTPEIQAEVERLREHVKKLDNDLIACQSNGELNVLKFKIENAKIAIDNAGKTLE